jgi:hypothetical protein
MSVSVKKAEQRVWRDELRPDFERRAWLVSWAVWVLMLLFVAAALIGFFGSGPISRTTAGRDLAGGAVELEHPRFARFHVAETMRLRVDAPGASGDTLRLLLSDEFTRQAHILDIDPAPDSTSLGPDGRVYAWRVEDWSRPLSVSIRYEPDDWGRIGGNARITAGNEHEETISLTQLVFP